MRIFLAHLVMTMYINYHFVWVTKWNLNIIKEHITFKQHLRTTVTELLHWELCTPIKEYWGFSNHSFEKFSILLNVIQCKTSKSLLSVIAKRGGITTDHWANCVCYLILLTTIIIETRAYSGVVDSTNRRGNFQLKNGPNKWQLGMPNLTGPVRSCLKSQFCYRLPRAFGFSSWG